MFLCVDNSPGWANKGAAQYFSSLNKQEVGLTPALLSAFVSNVCLKTLSIKVTVCVHTQMEPSTYVHSALVLTVNILLVALGGGPCICASILFEVSSCVSSRMCHAGRACPTNHCRTTQRAGEGTRK